MQMLKLLRRFVLNVSKTLGNEPIVESERVLKFYPDQTNHVMDRHIAEEIRRRGRERQT